MGEIPGINASVLPPATGRGWSIVKEVMSEDGAGETPTDDTSILPPIDRHCQK